ncbi:MAG: hypothetical protein R3C44_20020 [Chloroflexota bacterium]
MDEVMLTAFNLVLQQVPEARLMIVGHFAPPELEQEARSLARDLGIEAAVTMTGRVPFADVPGYLQH